MPNRELALKKYREGHARLAYDGVLYQETDFRRLYIGKLALKPGEVILDVGCGSGLSFSLLEEGVGREGSIIGIDQSPEQLALARTLVEQSGWENVTLINSAVEDAQIPVTADAALFSFTHDIMRTPLAVQNVVRSLKPGARIVVIGMKWAPWWALTTNWRTWRFTRNFISTFEGFSEPWSHLAKLVSSLEVELLIYPTPHTTREVSMYIAVGRK